MKRIISILLIITNVLLPLNIAAEVQDNEYLIDYCDFSDIRGWKPQLLNENAYEELAMVDSEHGYSYRITAKKDTSPFYMYSENISAFTDCEVTMECDFIYSNMRGTIELFSIRNAATTSESAKHYVANRLKNGFLGNKYVSTGKWHHIKYVFNMKERYSKTYLDYSEKPILESSNISESSLDGTFRDIRFTILGQTGTQVLTLDNIKVTAKAQPASITSFKTMSANGVVYGDTQDANDIFCADIVFDRPVGIIPSVNDFVKVTSGGVELTDCYTDCLEPENNVYKSSFANRAATDTVRIYFGTNPKKGENITIDLTKLYDEWGYRVSEKSVIEFSSDDSLKVKWLLLDENGNELDNTSDLDNKSVRLFAEVENLVSNQNENTLYMAVYDEEERLVAIKKSALDTSSGKAFTDALTINNPEKKKLTIKGYIWENHSLSPLFNKYEEDFSNDILTSDFSAFSEYTDYDVINPSAYFNGYTKAKEYFKDSICFALDSDYIYAKGKKYKTNDKPILHEGKMWVSVSLLESIYNKSEFKETKLINNREYAPIVKTAVEELKKNSYETEYGLAVISEESFIAKDEMARSILRYILFERPDSETLKLNAQSKAHPFLIADKSKFAKVKEKIQSGSNKRLKAMSESVIYQADTYSYDTPVETPTKSGAYYGLDYLGAMSLYWAYYMTNDAKYAEEAVSQALTMASWEHWFSDSNFFLQTSYAMAGCAYVYDLFYDYMSLEQRKALADGIIKNGILPAREHYYGRGVSDWPLRDTNWNIVCNAGTIVAALSIGRDYESDLCYDVLEKALKSLEYASLEYGPDGGWAEGSGYGGFTANYHVLALSSLLNVYNTDFGLANAPGLLKYRYFPFDMMATESKIDLHDDGRGSSLDSPAVMWMSNYTNDLTAQRLRIREALIHRKNRYALSDMIWYINDDNDNVIDAPLDSSYGVAEMASSRSSWRFDASYLGVHAGANAVSHGQLDIGQFVFESEGVRFALDMGSDSYNLPGYFNFGGLGREDYYHCRAEGHNVYVINPDAEGGQHYYAGSTVETVMKRPDGVIYKIDMTPAYRGQLRKASRGYMLHNNRRVLVVQDEVTPKSPDDEYYWFWHTDASVEIISDSHIRLSKANKELHLYFDSNVDFAISKGVSEPLPTSPQKDGQLANGKVNKITARFKSNNENTVFRVIAVPDGYDYEEKNITPIDNWKIADGIRSDIYEITDDTVKNVKYGETVEAFKSHIFSQNTEKVIKNGEYVTAGIIDENTKLEADGRIYNIEFLDIGAEFSASKRPITNVPLYTPCKALLNYIKSEAGECSCDCPDGYAYEGMKISAKGKSYKVTMKEAYFSASFDDETKTYTPATQTTTTAPKGFDTLHFTSEKNQGNNILMEPVETDNGRALRIKGSDAVDTFTIIQLQKALTDQVEKEKVVISFRFKGESGAANIYFEGRNAQGPYDLIKLTSDGVIYTAKNAVGMWHKNDWYNVRLEITPGKSNCYSLWINDEHIADGHYTELNKALTGIKIAARLYSGEEASMLIDDFKLARVYG